MWSYKKVVNIGCFQSWGDLEKFSHDVVSGC